MSNGDGEQSGQPSASGGGLKQEDFRKLLLTPRHSSGSRLNLTNFMTPRATNRPSASTRAVRIDLSATPNPYLPETPRRRNISATPKRGNSEFVKPSFSAAKKAKKSEEIASGYRDRAAERRRGENPDYAETEKILAAIGEASSTDMPPDSKLTYEQSKYLGGDAKHTHLVKGLDYALLAKQRARASEPEEVTKDDLEQLYEQKQKEREESKPGSAPKFMTGLGERIYTAVFELPQKKPTKNELFLPGRMSYVFELVDEAGDCSAFAIPTAVIRSRADFEDEFYGSSDPASDLVVEKIANIFANHRLGRRIEEKVIGLTPQPNQEQNQEPEYTQHLPEAEVPAKLDSDDKMFSDVDSDYELDLDDSESKDEANASENPSGQMVDEAEATDLSPHDYSLAHMVKQASLQATKPTDTEEFPELEENEGPCRRSIFEEPPELNVERAYIRGNGIEDDSGLMYNSSDSDEDEAQKALEVMDEGTSKNKRKQLSRWDFDDEESWARYKANQVHMPKAAFQFGVKMSESRPYLKKPANPEAKLNREYQQLKSFMEKKYKAAEAEDKPATRPHHRRHRRP